MPESHWIKRELAFTPDFNLFLISVVRLQLQSRVIKKAYLKTDLTEF
jgi:hypothetical protein